MLASFHPRSHPSRRLVGALLAAIAVLLVGLTAPDRGLASVAQWTPNPAGLVKTGRPCPSPTVAAYYHVTCWTVGSDQTSPFYSPQAPYPWAQCTYWALEMRPDLWNNRAGSDPNPSDWTAYTWAQHGALEGLTVDHVPAAGAVMVAPQTDDNATGHVAYVQNVSVDPSTGDDLVTIQEMNDTTFDDPSQGQGDTMTLPMDSTDLAAVQFVHTPGNTTPPTAPTTGATPTTTPSGAPIVTTISQPVTTKAIATRAPSRSGAGNRRRAHLKVHINRRGVHLSTLSPAPLVATVVTLPSGKVLSRVTLHVGSRLALPTGRFRLCVSQPAVGRWKGARSCLAGTHHGTAHAQPAGRRVNAFSSPATVAGLDPRSRG